jgi:Na+-driven multidrug efflux pump
VSGVVMGLGVMGIAWAMYLDWIVRDILNLARMKSGKWKRIKII